MYCVTNCIHSCTQSVDVAVTFTPRLDPQCVAEEGLRLAREELLKGAEKNAQLERERTEKQEQQQSTVISNTSVYK